MSYCDFLRESAERNGNTVCLGLDPVMDYIPARLGYRIDEIIPNFFEHLFDELSNKYLKPAAFKPNQGFFIKHDIPMQGDFSGSHALSRTIKLCREYFPHTPVILDYKRGDIMQSSHSYAKEGFERWSADAVTVSPYMGSDSVAPFLEYSSKGLGTYILNRTSNAGASDLQNLLLQDGSVLYEAVGNKIIEWSEKYPGTGAVVGATSLKELGKLAGRFSAHEIPLLIPGVGSQGGSAEEVVKTLKKVKYDLRLVRINSSSAIIHPWKKSGHIPEKWAAACAEALREMIDTCRIGV
ncbi:MAG: orotidine-5'-phosphate decarboxylase [Candidatus Marinimicrobia bacterium]|nr:orotidine-5'-phosphate decarboxylase [Candidatus Neomarinimicrobiota bacterium]